MAGAISMLGLFIVVAVQLIFAELHGSENFHHHRSDIVDGPQRSSEPTLNNKKIDLGMPGGLSRSAEEKAQFLRVILLEMGILFHSIFIGTPFHYCAPLCSHSLDRNGTKCIQRRRLCSSFYRDCFPPYVRLYICIPKLSRHRNFRRTLIRHAHCSHQI